MAKKDAFGGKDPLSWVSSRLGDNDPDEGQPVGGSPEEPMVPVEEPVITLAELEDIKEPTVEPATTAPEPVTVDEMRKAIEEALSPSQEQIGTFLGQIKVMADAVGQLAVDVAHLYEAQRDFGEQIQENLTSHHAETTGAIDKIAKSLQDAHEQLARQGNKAIDSTNGLASALSEEIQRARKSFVKTVWTATATATAVVVLACGLIVWPALNDITALLRSETIGARSTLEKRIEQLKVPEETEEAVPSRFGEKEHPSPPEKKAEPVAPDQPAPIRKRF